ncbi:MAG: DUF4846 domain-containing protein [Thermodesulfobacteriota bacterium]
MIPRILLAALLLAACHLFAAFAGSPDPVPAAGSPISHPWPVPNGCATVADRFTPPHGFQRVAVAPGSFGAWLRQLPVKPGRQEVMLYNGLPKGNQHAHEAVLALDVGSRDLMQCADAVMRLRAEYLLASGRQDEIEFSFTSGDKARWTAWREGFRPRVSGNRAQWEKTGKPDASYASFRRYLDSVFTYAGSHSLSRELVKNEHPENLGPGDVFIQGGFPGHAVLVLDVAANGKGQRVFLLCQSYMPAQEIQVLKNPADPGSPWYPARSAGVLETPEWVFSYADCRSFPRP